MQTIAAERRDGHGLAGGRALDGDRQRQAVFGSSRRHRPKNEADALASAIAPPGLEPGLS